MTKAELLDSIVLYIRHDNQGAIFLDGPWGTGKTHFIKNLLQDYLKSIDIDVIVISLFGKTKVGEIKNEILLENAIINSQNSNNRLKKLYKNTRKQISQLAGVLKTAKPDYAEAYNALGAWYFESKNFKNRLIVFDDFERSKLDDSEILGLINYLTESKNCKVLIVGWNKDKSINEKVIFREFKFEQNLNEIFESLLPKKLSPIFSKLIKSHREKIVSFLSNEEIRTQNLRTLKFLFESFNYISNEAEKSFTELDKTFDDEILTPYYSLFIFTSAVVIEYKAEEVTYEDRMNLADSNIDLLISMSNKGDFSKRYEAGEKAAYGGHFVKKYFSSQDEKYRYFESIYDYVTGGIPINLQTFKQELRQKFPVFVRKNIEDPIDKLHGNHSFLTDNEFIEILNQIYSNISSNLYSSHTDFLEGFFLLEIHHNLKVNYSVAEAYSKTLASINQILVNSNLDQLNIYKHEFSRLRTRENHPDQYSILLEELENAAISKYEEAQKIKGIELSNLFINNPCNVKKLFISNEQPIYIQEINFLENIQKSGLELLEENFTPHSIDCINEFLKFRFYYNTLNFDRKSEYLFLKKLKELINSRSFEERPLTEMYINSLSQTLTDIIKKKHA